jgi:hypothetical protein
LLINQKDKGDISIPAVERLCYELKVDNNELNDRAKQWWLNSNYLRLIAAIYRHLCRKPFFFSTLFT